MNKIFVAPSILAADFVNMQNSVESIKKWGGDFVHCDVMDGVFVPNLTFGMPMIKAIKAITDIPLDVHLMITEPERYIKEFVNAGADLLTFHPDASKAPKDTVLQIKNCGAKCGLVFNPNIDFEPYAELFKLCDIIVVMSVHAGYGGQKFMPETLLKTQKIAKYLSDNNLTNVLLEMDGGINDENAKLCVNAGANVLVAGSAVFNANDPIKTILKMKNNF